MEKRKIDGSLAIAKRLINVAQLIVGPTEAVDDVTVIWLEFDRLLDHPQRFLEIKLLVDHRVPHRAPFWIVEVLGADDVAFELSLQAISDAKAHLLIDFGAYFAS